MGGCTGGLWSKKRDQRIGRRLQRRLGVAWFSANEWLADTQLSSFWAGSSYHDIWTELKIPAARVVFV